MTIETFKIDKTKAILLLSGHLDTVNAPLLERKIKQWEGEVTELILDFSELEYISSMGLRVLLQAKKAMNEKKQRLVIKNMDDSIREVFQMTGFLNLMLLEEKFVIIRKDEADSIVLSFNGEMGDGNIPTVAEELSRIKEQDSPNPVKVILDMKKLVFVSPEAITYLKQVIADPQWEKRELCVQDIPEHLKTILKPKTQRERSPKFR